MVELSVRLNDTNTHTYNCRPLSDHRMFSNKHDTPELTAARDAERSAMRKWVEEKKKSQPAL